MKRITSLLAIVLCFSLFGCSSPSAEAPIFQVTPTELFAGEESKYKPFIPNAGGVKVTYRGEKESVRLLAEVWENGQLSYVHPQMGGFLTQANEDGTREWNGEVIISLDLTTNEEGNSRVAVRYFLFDDNGYVGFADTFDADRLLAGYSPIPLHEEQEVSPEEGEVAIWGFQGTDQRMLHAADFSTEQLERTDWAVVFKLAATEAEDESSGSAS